MPKFIDATPTWREIMPLLLHALRQGNAEGRRAAETEIYRLADFADNVNRGDTQPWKE